MALKFNPFTGTLDYVESGATKEKAEGVPAGGNTQTVLMKKSATNYDDEWKLIQNGNIELAANIEEAKLSLPEVVKKTTVQEITGEKQFQGGASVSKTLAVLGVFQNVPTVGQTLTGEVKEWEPGTISFIPVKPEAGAKLEGIKIPAAGNQSGTIITILNEGSNVLTIVDNAAGVTLGNKIRTETGANIELKLKGMIQFIYQGSRWRQLANQITAGEGLEILADKEVKMKALGVTEGLLGPESVTNGKVKKESLEPNRLEKEKLTSEQIKPEGIKEASLEKETVGFTKLGFFNDDAPIEIPAGKTYEVPSNVQGLWKESISVQGTLNIQGRFDEVGTPEEFGTAQIAKEAITTEKLGPESVTEPKIATGAVSTFKLGTESVTEPKIAAAAVAGTKIATGAVETKHIHVGAVTQGKCSFGTIVLPWKIVEQEETLTVGEEQECFFKENITIEGTLKIEGRLDEVGTPEGSPWFLPTVVTETQNIPVPAETWFRFSKINGIVKVQGELIGTT